MKFDHIIMNPPYCRNLHLKILNEAINHSDDIVNLSPIRWLQDPLAEYKRNSDFKKFKEIRERIESIEIIDTHTANILFNIMLLQPLGIYHVTSSGGYDTDHNEWYQKIFSKIIDENNFSRLNIKKYNNELNNYVCLNIMAPPMKYGRPMYDWLKNTGVCTVNNSYKMWKDSNPAATRGDVDNTLCAIFNSYEEALNCYNAMNTKLARFCCCKSVVDVHVHPEYAPWLDDYTHPWTDEDLYKYFELTDDEIRIIESEIK